MSLTDQAEMREMSGRPKIRAYNPRFHGDGKWCDYRTGHCTNTDSCNDCEVYLSVMEMKKARDDLRGD